MGVSGLNAERWSKETMNFLEGVAMRIENKHGRLKPQVVATEVQYQKSRAEIRRKMDHGPHFRSGLPKLFFCIIMTHVINGLSPK